MWLQAATLLLLSDGSDGSHFDTVIVFNSGFKSEQNQLTDVKGETAELQTGTNWIHRTDVLFTGKVTDGGK